MSLGEDLKKIWESTLEDLKGGIDKVWDELDEEERELIEEVSKRYAEYAGKALMGEESSADALHIKAAFANAMSGLNARLRREVKSTLKAKLAGVIDVVIDELL